MTKEELEKILDGRRMVVSVSGGKDSTAVCLHLMDTRGVCGGGCVRQERV